MPVPVGLDLGRHNPKSPYYEEPEPPEEYENRMAEKAEIEREKRILEEARHVTKDN